MVELKSKTTSLTFPVDNLPKINAKLEEFQSKFGESSFLNEIFLKLLDRALEMPDFTENSQEIEDRIRKELQNEFSDNFVAFPVAKERRAEILEKFKELQLKHSAEFSENRENSFEILLEIAAKPATVETIEVEKPAELAHNEFVLRLDEKQLEVAKQISINRNAKGDFETIPEMFVKRFFTKDSLYNWTGNFYTGFNK